MNKKRLTVGRAAAAAIRACARELRALTPDPQGDDEHGE